ncbi:MAG: RES family NAD+ phosphorylase [Rhizobacter sp.]|nr:RES family NAD+ phosphorylase [Rhizobacter sp.]
MRLWRIAAETRKYPAHDLSGGGAAASPGRWNEEKQAVLYTAPSIAIAVLETASHIDDGGLPLNRFLVQIDLPDAVWEAREELDMASLPPAWAAIPAGRASVRIGSQWLAEKRSLVLLVPSVIVPEERAALLNPLHPDASQMTAKVLRPFEYNRLFRLG